MKRISVIIPCYNDPIGLEMTLESLKRQSLSSDFFEIVVGNDGSSIEVEKVCEIFNVICVNISPRSGISVARNRAIAKSSCDFLAFTDADVFADKDWLLSGLKALEEHIYVGGKIIIDIKDKHKIFNYYEYLTLFNNRDAILKKYCIGANFFIRKECFLKTDGFNENFFCGAEDLEFGVRFCDFFRIKPFYCEEAIIFHPADKDLNGILNKLTRNRESSRFLYELYPKRFSNLKQGILKPFKIFLIHPLNVLRSNRRIRTTVKIKVFFWSFYLGFLDSLNYIKNRIKNKQYYDFFK